MCRFFHLCTVTLFACFAMKRTRTAEDEPSVTKATRRVALCTPAIEHTEDNDMLTYGAPVFLMPKDGHEAAWLAAVKPVYVEAYEKTLKETDEPEDIEKYIAALHEKCVFDDFLMLLWCIAKCVHPGNAGTWTTTRTESAYVDLKSMWTPKRAVVAADVVSRYELAKQRMKESFKAMRKTGLLTDNVGWFECMKHMPAYVGLPEDLIARKTGAEVFDVATCVLSVISVY